MGLAVLPAGADAGNGTAAEAGAYGLCDPAAAARLAGRGGALGVTLRPAGAYRLPDGTRFAGARVMVVEPGGAAAAAGIRSGDILYAVDGTVFATADDLRRFLGAHAPGQTVRVELLRRGTRARLFADVPLAGTATDAAPGVLPWLGESLFGSGARPSCR